MAIDQSVAVDITNNSDFVDIVIQLLRMYFTVFHIFGEYCYSVTTFDSSP